MAPALSFLLCSSTSLTLKSRSKHRDCLKVAMSAHQGYPTARRDCPPCMRRVVGSNFRQHASSENVASLIFPSITHASREAKLHTSSHSIASAQIYTSADSLAVSDLDAARVVNRWRNLATTAPPFPPMELIITPLEGRMLCFTLL